MNEKAFTLVELIAVIIIVALVVLISSPIISGSMSKAREKTYEQQAYSIETAAKKWALYNDILDSEYCVSLNKLKEDGYIEDDIINNPIDKSEMNGSVILEFSNNSYKATYQEKQCD